MVRQLLPVCVQLLDLTDEVLVRLPPVEGPCSGDLLSSDHELHEVGSPRVTASLALGVFEPLAVHLALLCELLPIELLHSVDHSSLASRFEHCRSLSVVSRVDLRELLCLGDRELRHHAPPQLCLSSS